VPRHSSLDLVKVNVFSRRKKNFSDKTLVFVEGCTNQIHRLFENKVTQMRGGLGTKRLSFFGSVDSFQPDLLLLSGLGQDFDSIAVNNTYGSGNWL
jgi:hypothetical protein